MQKKRFNVYHGQKRMPWATGTAVWEPRGFVFLSGSEGINTDTDEVVEGIGPQTRLAMEKVKRRLEELGTSLENIVHIWVYIVGKDFPDGVWLYPNNQERWKTLQEFWRQHCPEFLENPPAGTLIGVPSLARKEMLVEILVFAAIP